jgi:hypothetical protein
MPLGLILVFILVIILLCGFSGHFRGYGYGFGCGGIRASHLLRRLTQVQVLDSIFLKWRRSASSTECELNKSCCCFDNVESCW